MYNTAEVIENLILMDDFAGQMGFKPKSLFIIGGTAMMLQGCQNKFSSDVDIVNENIDESELEFINSFATNNDAAEVVLIAEDFESRVKKMKFGRKTYTYCVASLEDIVATKIGRFDASDIQDLQVSDILDRVDTNLLFVIGEGLAAKSKDYESKWGRFKKMFFNM